MHMSADAHDRHEQDLMLLRARRARAREHHMAFGAIWAEYLEGRPHQLRTTERADGTTSITLHRTEPFPTQLSLVFGELLYQLRASLDTCLYSVASMVSGQSPPPAAERLEWPIRTTQEDWDKQANRYKHLPAPITNALQMIQPYRAQVPSLNCLQILHDLARVDRHRRAHPLELYISRLRITWDKQKIDLVHTTRQGIVQDGDEIVRLRLRDRTVLTPDTFDLTCEFDPEILDIQESTGPGGASGRPWDSLGSRLGALVQAVDEYTDGLVEIAKDLGIQEPWSGVVAPVQTKG